MFITRTRVTVTTDESGDATSYSDAITGEVRSIRYIKNNFASGVDFDITLEHAGTVLWSEDDVNASDEVNPVVSVQTAADVDVPDVYRRAHAVNDRVKIVVAGGGDTKSGVFEIEVG